MVVAEDPDIQAVDADRLGDHERLAAVDFEPLSDERHGQRHRSRGGAHSDRAHDDRLASDVADQREMVARVHDVELVDARVDQVQVPVLVRVGDDRLHRIERSGNRDRILATRVVFEADDPVFGAVDRQAVVARAEIQQLRQVTRFKILANVRVWNVERDPVGRKPANVDSAVVSGRRGAQLYRASVGHEFIRHLQIGGVHAVMECRDVLRQHDRQRRIAQHDADFDLRALRGVSEEIGRFELERVPAHRDHVEIARVVVPTRGIHADTITHLETMARHVRRDDAGFQRNEFRVPAIDRGVADNPPLLSGRRNRQSVVRPRARQRLGGWREVVNASLAAMDEFVAAEAVAEHKVRVFRVHLDLVVASSRVDVGVPRSEQLDEIPIVAAVDRDGGIQEFVGQNDVEAVAAVRDDPLHARESRGAVVPLDADDFAPELIVVIDVPDAHALVAHALRIGLAQVCARPHVQIEIAALELRRDPFRREVPGVVVVAGQVDRRWNPQREQFKRVARFDTEDLRAWLDRDIARVAVVGEPEAHADQRYSEQLHIRPDVAVDEHPEVLVSERILIVVVQAGHAEVRVAGHADHGQQANR